MTQGTSNGGRPFFLMEDLIAALNARGAEVLSPLEQMERESISDQESVARAIAASLQPVQPVPPALSTSAPSTSTARSLSTVSHGDWTMIHANGAPVAILTGEPAHAPAAPIPDAFVDDVVSALQALRVSRISGSFAAGLNPIPPPRAADSQDEGKGKGKEDQPEDVKEKVADQLNADAGLDDAKYNLVPPRDITGFVCAKCNTHNLVRSASETWYAVTVGKDVGIFNGWPIVQPLVSGVSGACYKKYKSEHDAREAYNRALDAGTVAIVA